MEYVLDNPAWHALVTGNSNLAKGTGEVKYFDKEISPFVGLNEYTTDGFDMLYRQITHYNPVIFISPDEVAIPPKWKLLNHIVCLQMIYDEPNAAIDNTIELVALQQRHVPQMLALTKLTNPGPFAERTIEFGHYYGIFDGDKLIAMAGQRMHPTPYAEISAVCTHPDYLGKGYARQLLLGHANRIIKAGDIPMLHVRSNNERAVNVYESMGFTSRKELNFKVLQKVI